MMKLSFLLILEKKKKSFASLNNVLNNLLHHRRMNMERCALDVLLLRRPGHQRVWSLEGVANDILVLFSPMDLDGEEDVMETILVEGSDVLNICRLGSSLAVQHRAVIHAHVGKVFAEELGRQLSEFLNIIISLISQTADEVDGFSRTEKGISR